MHTAVRLLTFMLTVSAALIAMRMPVAGKEPMWFVEKDGTRVYLLGSLHALPRSVSPARPALIRAFNDSKKVYFEIASIAGSNPEVDKFFNQQGKYKQPDKLKRHLSADATGMVNLVLPLFQLRWTDVEDHKPWLLGMRLQQSLLRSKGFAAAKGVDEYFEELARKKGKPVAGLETPREQLGFFGAMSDSEQSAALVNDIEGLVWLRKDLEMMGKLWELGAAEQFEAGLASQQSSKAGKRIFRDRNLRWMPQVIRLIEGKDNTLVIVGMGHLVGSDGLVSLLRARGYPVRQM